MVKNTIVGDEMKRGFSLGLILGLVMALPITAFGSEVISMIGKKVDGQFPLIINGVQTEKPAVSIEGTSYIPVRSAGELFGYDVSFVDSEVILRQKTETVTEATYAIQSADLERLGEMEVELLKHERAVDMDRQSLKKFKEEKPKDAPAVTDYETFQAEAIAAREKKIADLKAEIAKIKAKYNITETP
jgi:hypothetical protein